MRVSSFNSVHFIFVLSGLLISHHLPVQGQTQFQFPIQKSRETGTGPKEDEEQQDTDIEASQASKFIDPLKLDALESYIIPEEYWVGPGDQLLISIFGQVNKSFTTGISPEGFLLVPTVNTIDVKNKNLSQLKETVTREMAKIYSNAEISINLISLRSFRIHVTGMVNKSGKVVVSPIDRVSAVVDKVMGLKKNASLRNIIIKRKDGTVLKADLMRKLNSGDVNADPFLKDGDVIHFPPVYSNVSIFGAVQLPGPFEFVENETLTDLIDVAGGLMIDADSSSGELIRFSGSKSDEFEKKDFKVTDVFRHKNDTTKNLKLKPNDRVFVRSIPDFQKTANVQIEGEVNYPGTYSIIDRVTKISEVLSSSGGLTEKASIDNIVIYRSIKYEGKDFEYERLKLTPILDMNDIEKSYFKIKTRQFYPTVQTDFRSLFAEKLKQSEYDLILRDGDRISIGTRKKTVRVLGAVIKPGIVDYRENENYLYYINLCKGLSSRADKGEIHIIKPETEIWAKAGKNVQIVDGDVIFVPEKEPVDGWKIFRETIATVGQLASITATIILIYFSINK